MSAMNYQQLTLRWQPNKKGDWLFLLLVAVCVVALLVGGIVLSTMEVPKRPRAAKPVVPERVAKFITERKKPKPKPPAPKPKPKLKPKPEPKKEPKPDKPKVERKKPKKVKKPITKAQKKAREKAAKSGLLAHMSDLNDLMDTSEVSKQVKGSINKSKSAKQSAGLNAKVFAANSAEGSGGVDATKYASTAGSTQLSKAELTAAQAALAATDDAFAKVEDGGAVSAKSRSEEEITLVMDRYKGQLQSLYNRARRTNPSLKGKLVLAITIMPDGSVSKVSVVSSELNDTKLERRIVARVKGFKFGAKDVDVVTVNYPIEFLP